MSGVPFKIYESLVRGKVQIGFTSFNGRRWRQLLHCLPKLIRESDDVFPAHLKEPLARLMELFNKSLSLASTGQRSDAEALAAKTREWMQAFLQLGALGVKGFGEKGITPYCHILHVHVPFAVHLHGSLSKLSGEMLEKQNHELRQTFLRRTIHRDPEQTMQMEKRRELQLMIAEVESQEKPKRTRREGPQHPW